MSWRTVALGDVCSIVNGGTPKSEVSEYWDGDLNWITPKEMGKLTSREITSTERKITEKGIKNSSAKLLPINSVILSSRAPIGHLAINKSLMATNQGCKGLVPSEKLNYEYLYYFLSHSKKLLNDMGSGATFKELSGSKLATVEIPLPPLSIQKKIVAKLDAIFAEIDKAIAATEANCNNAEALFQSYITQIFQRNDVTFKTNKISEIAKIRGGKRVPKGYQVKTEKTPYVYLRVTDFGDNGSIDTENLRYVDKDVYDVIKNYIINSEDLYISIAGTIGRTGIVPKHLSGSLLTENACRLVFDKNINNRYVYYFTKSSDFISQMTEQTRTAAQPKLALSRLGEITLCVPSYEIQTLIVNKLDKLYKEIYELKEKYSAKVQFLKILKNLILNKAFSGELIKE